MSSINIALDGPAAAGKSTIAKQVASRLTMIYVDTGAMYRAITYKYLQNGKPSNFDELIQSTELELTYDKEKGQRIILDGKDVTDYLREMTSLIMFLTLLQRTCSFICSTNSKDLAAKKGLLWMEEI